MLLSLMDLRQVSRVSVVYLGDIGLNGHIVPVFGFCCNLPARLVAQFFNVGNNTEVRS